LFCAALLPECCLLLRSFGHSPSKNVHAATLVLFIHSASLYSSMSEPTPSAFMERTTRVIE
jgi:hypothetical protein